MNRDLTTSREIRRKYLEYMDRLEWRQFSFEVIDHYGGECWACGGEDDLQAHHLVYRNVMPWEYGMNEMRCLCRRCHAAVHNVADMAWVELLRFEVHELEIVLKRLRNCDAKCKSFFGYDIPLVDVAEFTADTHKL